MVHWPMPKTMDEYEFGTNATGGIGLGGDYKEYHILNGQTSDEELQVWTWGSSYGTQYREVAGGGDARRQAWSFGGTRTANMPCDRFCQPIQAAMARPPEPGIG